MVEAPLVPLHPSAGLLINMLNVIVIRSYHFGGVANCWAFKLCNYLTIYCVFFTPKKQNQSVRMCNKIN